MKEQVNALILDNYSQVNPVYFSLGLQQWDRIIIYDH